MCVLWTYTAIPSISSTVRVALVSGIGERSRRGKGKGEGKGTRRAYLGGKLQAGQRLGQMGLQRTDHDEHEGLAVSAEGELEEICQLSGPRLR